MLNWLTVCSLRPTIDWLLDPLSYDFMRQALLAGVLISILCPVVGTYLIVQQMALLGDVVWTLQCCRGLFAVAPCGGGGGGWPMYRIYPTPDAIGKPAHNLAR